MNGGERIFSQRRIVTMVTIIQKTESGQDGNLGLGVPKFEH